jgi:pimeloyl-ACP methyl ester carboxylesterase
VIVGEDNLSFYNHPIANWLASCIPRAQKEILPGVGYMANMEVPHSFNGLVTRFLAALSA